MRRELDVRSAEGVAPAGAEVRERHAMAAADACVQVMNLAGEAVRRQPLRHRVGIQEGAVDALRRSAEHAMEANRAGVV